MPKEGEGVLVALRLRVCMRGPTTSRLEPVILYIVSRVA